MVIYKVRRTILLRVSYAVYASAIILFIVNQTSIPSLPNHFLPPELKQNSVKRDLSPFHKSHADLSQVFQLKKQYKKNEDQLEEIYNANNDSSQTKKNVVCTMPEQTRLHPFCSRFRLAKFQRDQQNIKYNKTKCFMKYGFNKTDNCGILKYMSEVESWCPVSPERQTAIVSNSKKFDKPEIRKNLQDLMQILKNPKLKWLRERISGFWPEWVKAIENLEKTSVLSSRKKLKVLLFPGSFAIFKLWLSGVDKGSPLGELVQWSDLITSVFTLGHDINILMETQNLLREYDLLHSQNRIPNYYQSIFSGVDEDGCISRNKTVPGDHFDIIFTDIIGLAAIKNYSGPLYSKLRCKLRILDSFGTEAEFNYAEYKDNIAGGRSQWGNQDLDLRQFMTMFPHSPDNTFLGFVSGVKMDLNEARRVKSLKRNQSLIYGKLLEYWQGKEQFLHLVNTLFEVHATAVGKNSILGPTIGPTPEPAWELSTAAQRLMTPCGTSPACSSPNFWHPICNKYGNPLMKKNPFVTNHGILTGSKVREILYKSKVFLGLGFPLEGPAPLEAIANGAVFINPKISSQNPYLEEFVGEPYVYTIDIDNFTLVEEILQKIQRRQMDPFLPFEFTHEGMLQRVAVLLENQDLCGAKLWPPMSALKLVLSERNKSCKESCWKKGLICEPGYWEIINQERFMQSLVKCTGFKSVDRLHAPSFDPVSSICYKQAEVMLFSCVAKDDSVKRFCPCRDYIKEQVALCKQCV